MPELTRARLIMRSDQMIFSGRLLLVVSIAAASSPPLTRSVGSVTVRPGHAVAPVAWPRFLFLFRGTLQGFAQSEVRAVARYAGVDAERVMFEATPQGTHTEDLFQWVSMPSASVAAAVATRCSLVRHAFDIWAEARYDPDETPLDAASAAERGCWRAGARVRVHGGE